MPPGDLALANSTPSWTVSDAPHAARPAVDGSHTVRRSQPEDPSVHAPRKPRSFRVANPQESAAAFASAVDAVKASKADPSKLVATVLAAESAFRTHEADCRTSRVALQRDVTDRMDELRRWLEAHVAAGAPPLNKQGQTSLTTLQGAFTSLRCGSGVRAIGEERTLLQESFDRSWRIFDKVGLDGMDFAQLREFQETLQRMEITPGILVQLDRELRDPGCQPG
ncbi:MAG TPA: hypothetical protein VHA82_07890 [Ramlibacter sp.]|uniref:hypothetical protein n=1 Tax=Ramlibacter sp. TaxID=1917967 RepID=UPI002CD9B96A|nr:hypothetical protein [Ramlibacter sp.]HVZ43718.1 hypothetical protein [Ramlibacter sp.]